MATQTDVTRREDTRFFGHPRGLATLFFTEMWERFSYYGMRALLILFMTAPAAQGGLGFETAVAGAIYGLYTSSVYMACGATAGTTSGSAEKRLQKASVSRKASANRSHVTATRARSSAFHCASRDSFVSVEPASNSTGVPAVSSTLCNVSKSNVRSSMCH